MMPGKEPDIGPSARTVADNVGRYRKAQNLNYTELSERLKAKADWTINAVGIRRIEAGERRVTPDDLVALAIAFGISPISLLLPGMPGLDAPSERVEVTGIKEPVYASDFWHWLSGEVGPPSWLGVSPPLYDANARPAWKWHRCGEDGDDRKV
jgi:transcriptional regulator with XRE-family HTH domain